MTLQVAVEYSEYKAEYENTQLAFGVRHLGRFVFIAETTLCFLCVDSALYPPYQMCGKAFSTYPNIL